MRKCLTCGTPTNNPKFCSKSCAVTFTNKGRKVTKKKDITCGSCGIVWQADVRARKGSRCPDCQKEYARQRSRLRRPDKYYCKGCGKQREQPKKQYCNSCLEKRNSKLTTYRTEARFRFSISDFPEYFDGALIEKYGWYSPTNKNNNLGGVSRDHKLSVADGFRLGIDPKIIAHPANCQLLRHCDNSSKNSSSSITLEELKKEIKKFEIKFGKYSKSS